MCAREIDARRAELTWANRFPGPPSPREAYLSFHREFGTPEFAPYYVRLRTALEKIEGARIPPTSAAHSHLRTPTLPRLPYAQTSLKPPAAFPALSAAWMAANGAPCAGCLRPGASAEEIEEAEMNLSSDAPMCPAVKLLYRRGPLAAPPSLPVRPPRFSPPAAAYETPSSRPQHPQRPGGREGLLRGVRALTHRPRGGRHSHSTPLPSATAAAARSYSFYDTYVDMSFLSLPSVQRLTGLLAHLARPQAQPLGHASSRRTPPALCLRSPGLTAAPTARPSVRPSLRSPPDTV